MTGTRTFGDYSEIFNVKDYGSIQDGINACSLNGGGIVFLPSNTYEISASLVIPSFVKLMGSSASTTIIKIADGANCYAIKSINFDDLTGSNKYAPTDPEVPYWYGLKDLSIDCNGDNQTAGGGIQFYGNAYSFEGKIIVRDAYEDAIYTEGPAAATLTSWLGQEEGFFDAVVLAIKPKRYGWLYRGPHNSKINEFRCLLHEDGDYGFKSETTVNYTAVLDGFNIIHVYGEATNTTNRKGISIGGITKGNLIQGDSTNVIFENVAVGKAKSQINSVRVTGVGKGATNAIGLKVDEAEVLIGRVEAATNASASAATCIEWNGALGGISQIYMTDDSADCNGLVVNGANTSFDNISINGFSGSGRVGVEIASSAVMVRGFIANCDTALKYTSGSRLNADLDIFTASGQNAWSGQTPNGGSDKVQVTATGNIVANNPSKVLSASISTNTTTLQTFSIAHKSLWTPSTADVVYSFRSATSGLDWEIPPTLLTIDATNLNFECKLATAVSGSAFITAFVDV